MIRLIVTFIGIFLLWLWLGSPFSKRAKIVVTLFAIAAAIALVSYEIYMDKPRQGLIEPSEVSVCGVTVKHTYRTDHRVQLCVKNQANNTVKRLGFVVKALRCSDDNECETVESASRDMSLTVAAGQTLEFEQTLRFETVTEGDASVSWSAEIVDVKAIP